MQLISHPVSSPLGTLTLVARGPRADALAGLYLPRQAQPVAPPGTAPIFAAVARQLAEYFAHARTDFDVPLDPAGTPFQRLVWDRLVAIPHGTTTTYGALAAALGRPAASRAVGAANGQNPISILVPCHRVVAQTGALTGYAGGLAAKRWLLGHEAASGFGLRASGP